MKYLQVMISSEQRAQALRLSITYSESVSSLAGPGSTDPRDQDHLEPIGEPLKLLLAAPVPTVTLSEDLVGFLAPPRAASLAGLSASWMAARYQPSSVHRAWHPHREPRPLG